MHLLLQLLENHLVPLESNGDRRGEADGRGLSLDNEFLSRI